MTTLAAAAATTVAAGGAQAVPVLTKPAAHCHWQPEPATNTALAGAAGHALHTASAPSVDGEPGVQGVEAYEPTGQAVQAVHLVFTPTARGEPALAAITLPRGPVVGPPLPHVPLVKLPAGQLAHAASTVSTEQPPLPQLLHTREV